MLPQINDDFRHVHLDEIENKRTATAALLSDGSQVIVYFELWKFYENSTGDDLVDRRLLLNG